MEEIEIDPRSEIIFKGKIYHIPDFKEKKLKISLEIIGIFSTLIGLILMILGISSEYDEPKIYLLFTILFLGGGTITAFTSMLMSSKTTNDVLSFLNTLNVMYNNCDNYEDYSLVYDLFYVNLVNYNKLKYPHQTLNEQRELLTKLETTIDLFENEKIRN